MDIALRWWTSPHLEMPRNAFQTNVQIAEKSGNSLKGKMPKRAVSNLTMIRVTEWMRTETLCESLKDIWITYLFEGHKFWLILMSTNLETPTNHTLVGHIWPQTPQKNYIYVFIFKQGKQCKNAELVDVGGKLSPSGHQMYQASIDNVNNCSWKPNCLRCECIQLSLKSDHCICIIGWVEKSIKMRFVYKPKVF